MHDRNVGVTVDGPGVSQSNDWAVVGVRTNSIARVDFQPDSILMVRDGQILGRAVAKKGAEIGYALRLRPYYPTPKGEMDNQALYIRNCQLPSGQLIGIGAQSGGDYTRDRSYARAGDYKGGVRITASVIQ